VTLQVWEHEDESVAATKRWQERGCCKVGIAKYVAQKLGIRHEVVDMRDTFRRNVIQDFVTGYASGITPNPCIRCNERVKLRALHELAHTRGIESVATGHYARVVRTEGGQGLHRAVDGRKDQSYFLYRMDPGWLSRTIFPVGAMQKSDVWKEAEGLGLPADELKESQEICFVSQGDYRTFIEQELPQAKMCGQFVDTTGRMLGKHDGIAFYTPGQRRGLGISGGTRLYVQKVIPETRTVVVCGEDDLMQSHCTVTDLNLFDDELLKASREVTVKVRHATPPIRATTHHDGTGTIRIEFVQPQRALSPGQSAVFYDGELVLGGGIIQRS
jgi:tRNA-specific 2-thiouridylase